MDASCGCIVVFCVWLVLCAEYVVCVCVVFACSVFVRVGSGLGCPWPGAARVSQRGCVSVCCQSVKRSTVSFLSAEMDCQDGMHGA